MMRLFSFCVPVHVWVSVDLKDIDSYTRIY